MQTATMAASKAIELRLVNMRSDLVVDNVERAREVCDSRRGKPSMSAESHQMRKLPLFRPTSDGLRGHTQDLGDLTGRYIGLLAEGSVQLCSSH